MTHDFVVSDSPFLELFSCEDGSFPAPPPSKWDCGVKTKLTKEEIARYSRQLLMPQVGMRGQIALRRSSVLILGAGGLGAPASIYLAAAGIGRLGLVDYDIVESNNLHRQIIHDEEKVGWSKVHSAAASIRKLNSNVECILYKTLLCPENAFSIIQPFDIVLDCSDNVATRYLVNDVCVLLNKPLVSGSALRMEGQITVYNYGEDGPCYRCLFPKPPPAHTVTNCGDGGVLGAVPGIIGTLQATECMKVLIQLHTGIGNTAEILCKRMLILDAQFMITRIVKLRSRRPECVVCGLEPSIDRQLIDYEAFCGGKACDKSNDLKLLTRSDRISCQEFLERQESENHVLVDVREPLEFDICALPNSLNFPLSQLNPETILELAATYQKEQIYVICRRGNRSQQAIERMRNVDPERFGTAKDIIGGLLAWSRDIDSEFPVY